MKKNYQLTATNKEPARVVEAIKNDIRKYIKREKRKTLPEGMNVWNMDCKFAQNDDEPQVIAFQDIMKSIDAAAEANLKSVYVEIISIAIKKERKIEEAVETEVAEEITIEEETEEENTEIEPDNN